MRQRDVRRALGSVGVGWGRREPTGDACQFRLFMGAGEEAGVCGVEEEERREQGARKMLVRYRSRKQFIVGFEVGDAKERCKKIKVRRSRVKPVLGPFPPRKGFSGDCVCRLFFVLTLGAYLYRPFGKAGSKTSPER